MNKFKIKIAMVLALMICLISPAFSKGKAKIKYALLGPTGILGTIEKRTVRVHGTEPGSPADGKLKEGDVIKDFVDTLTQAVLAAEAADGKLTLNLASGKQVVLELAALGRFSPTAFSELKVRGRFFQQANVVIYLNGKLVAKIDNLERGGGMTDSRLTGYALKQLVVDKNTIAISTRHKRRWGPWMGKYKTAIPVDFSILAREELSVTK